MSVRGTFPSQIWLHHDPPDPFRLVPRAVNVVRLCQRSSSAVAGTSPDLMAPLSRLNTPFSMPISTTSIVRTHLRIYMGSILLRCSRVRHNDYLRKTGQSSSGGTVTGHPF